MNNFRDLEVYQKAFEISQRIFEITKLFPKEELYSLSTQIRCSSRTVCAKIAKAYSKIDYLEDFKQRINDAEMKNCETQVWLDFAFHCGYLDRSMYCHLYDELENIGIFLNQIILEGEK